MLLDELSTGSIGGLNKEESYLLKPLSKIPKPTFKWLRGGELAMLAVFCIKLFEAVVCYSMVVSALMKDRLLAEAAFFGLGLRRLGMILGNMLFHQFNYHVGSRIVMMLGVLLMIPQSMLLFVVRHQVML